MRSQGGQGTEQPPRPEPVSQAIAAEAAVWIARLHGPDRSTRMERACLVWQARSPAHRLAFERCTDLWMDAAGLTRSSIARVPSSLASEDGQRAGRLQPRPWAIALTAAFLAGVLLWLQPWRDVDTYATAVGEQRLLVLHDGTRLSLNTATKVRVELGTTQRTVTVDGGEALFEVAKDASRPFVVRAADTEVTATGTAFVVRIAPDSKGVGDALSVTLIEGQVVVRDAAGGATDAVLRPSVVMTAGERMRLRRPDGVGAPGAATQVDRPRMDQLLAWKRGEAVFDNMSLPEAVAEMNRYSPTPITLTESDALSRLRVSGLFRTGDNASFARAMAALHGLVVRAHANRLELASK